MMSARGLAASLVLCFSACGGGAKKVKEPKVEKPVVEAPKPETEGQREAKRAAARLAIVPDGSNCLPAALKEPGAPPLELASVGADAILCAVDNGERMLGEVACWKVDLKNMGDGKVPLIYQPTAPQPGHDIIAKVIDGCALGFCSPGKNASADVAHLSWSSDGAKVAMLVGTDVHLFDAATKSHASTFSITGDKGVTGPATAIHLVADSVVVEGGDDQNAFVFKLDGTAVGPIMGLGGKDEKPLSLKQKGTFSVLDPMKIAIAERGLDTFTEYEIASGKRTKSLRKPKVPCKPAEIEAFWNNGDKVTDKCKDALAKVETPWLGATAVMGSHSLLFALKGERIGELAIVDPKTLAETKKALKMPWCGDDAASGAKADDAAPAKSRAAVKKGGDPQDGGE